MTTEDLVERIKRHPVIVGSVAVLVVCFFGYYFRMDMLSELESQHDEIATRLMRVENNLVAGASLDDHLEMMRSRVVEIDERIIHQPQLAENLKYFYELESETGAGLADLRQNVVGSSKASGNTAYSGVGYSLILTGNFRQVIAYFDELENGPRLYRLSNFSLQRGRDTARSSLTLALNLELLGWP